MESKVSYTVIGLFVIVLGAAGIGLAMWLGFGDLGKDYRTYLVYMTESVSGLYVDAPVKYKGVEVGKVRTIEIAPNKPQEVRLTLDIEADVPIKQDTVAVLSVQGLTGVAFVDLTGGSAGSPPLEAKNGQRYPVIKSGPSLFGRLDKAVSELLTNVNSVAKDAHELLNPKTRRAFQQTLANVESLTRNLARQQQTMDKALTSAAKVMNNSARASARLPALLDQVRHSARSLDAMARSMAHTSDAVRTAVDRGAGDLQTFSRQTLPQVTDLVTELRQLTGNLQRLSRKLEENPQMLLYGPGPQAPGPGE